jgi:hypothetical protein
MGAKGARSNQVKAGFYTFSMFNLCKRAGVMGGFSLARKKPEGWTLLCRKGSPREGTIYAKSLQQNATAFLILMVQHWYNGRKLIYFSNNTRSRWCRAPAPR